MQIIEIIQVGGLQGYSIRLDRKNKYYLYSSDALCVSKGKNTIDEVRDIIRCQDPHLYNNEHYALEEAKELIYSFKDLVDKEMIFIGGFYYSHDKMLDNCKKCAIIIVDKILSLMYGKDNQYYHYLLVKDEIEKYKP